MKERPDKKETLVIRLDSDVHSRLSEIAAKERISLTQVANIGLRAYGEWGSLYQAFKLAVVSKSLLREFFATIPQKQARELGRKNGKEEGPAMVTFWFKKFDLESVLSTFERILGRYSGAFVFEHSQDGPIHNVVVKHDMGMNASAYYAEYAKSLCTLLGMSYDVTETEEQIVVRARRLESTASAPSAAVVKTAPLRKEIS